LGSQKGQYALKADGKLQSAHFAPEAGFSKTTFGKGDTVGCGLIISTREVFFTLNGKFVGIGFKGIDLGLDATMLSNDLKSAEIQSKQVAHTKLYACICLQSQGETISANFGTKPYCFDIVSFS
jgi:hypothetical protein